MAEATARPTVAARLSNYPARALAGSSTLCIPSKAATTVMSQAAKFLAPMAASTAQPRTEEDSGSAEPAMAVGLAAGLCSNCPLLRQPAKRHSALGLKPYCTASPEPVTTQLGGNNGCSGY